MMTKPKLTTEEREILKDIEKGDFRSRLSSKRIEKLKAAADDTFKKDRRIDIRISSRDLEGLQRRALEEGVRLVCAGEDPGGEGFFLQPTLFADCNSSMRIVQEEIFRLVLVAIPFDDEEEVPRLANDNIYGLAASLFTRDISRAHRLLPRIVSWTVWVNTHDLIEANTPSAGSSCPVSART